MAEPAAVAFVFVLAAVLVTSAAAKAVAPAAPRAALRALGVPERVARSAVPVVALVEWALAVAIVLDPRNRAIVGAVVSLFVAFAVGGTAALVRRTSVECGCFGPLTRVRLGWAQLWQLAFVVAAAASVLTSAPSWNRVDRVELLLTAQLTAAAVLLGSASSTWARIRRDRVSLAASRVYAGRGGDGPAVTG